MEINKNIHLLKNVLTSCEKKISCRLSEITHVKLDVDTCFDTIVGELHNAFSEEPDEQELRNVHLFLLVNTNMSITEDLENDHNVGCAAGSCPPLSQYFYLRIAIKFGLLRYIKEIIECGPIVLALEVLNLIDTQCQYLNVIDQCKVNETVLTGILTRIKFTACRYTKRKLHEIANERMLFYKLDDSEARTINKEYFREVGYKVLSLLKQLRVFLKLILNLVPGCEPMEFYKMSLSAASSTWYDDDIFKTTAEIMTDCYEMIYYKCKAYICQVNVGMYMEWHEIQYDAKRTLQVSVGEEAFYISKLFENHQSSSLIPEDLLSLIEMLKSFAKQPEVVAEEVCKPKLTLEHMEKLISESDKLEMSLLKDIEIFLLDCKELEYEIAIKVIRKLCSETVQSSADLSLLREICVYTLRKLKLEDVVRFLKDFISEHAIEKVLSEPEADLKEVFEKLNEVFAEDNESGEEVSGAEKDEVLKEVIIQSLQSIKFTLTKLIERGTSEEIEQKAVLQVLAVMKPVCVHVPESVDHMATAQYSTLLQNLKFFLQNNFHKISPLEKQSFTNLIISLQNMDLINSDEFLAFCLLPMLYLRDPINWETVAELLKLFQKFYSSCAEKTTLSKSIILIQLAQMLEQSRWSVQTYSSHRVVVCEELLILMDIFLNSYSENIGFGEDFHWLHMQLKRFTYLTRSYFCNVYPITEIKTTETLFLSLIHKPSDVHTEFMKIHTQNETELILPLSKIIVSVTSKELQNIVHNYSVGTHKRVFFILNLLSEVTSFVCNSASQLAETEKTDSETIFSCLGYLVNTYLHVLEINVTNYPSLDDEATYVKCINRIAAMLKIFPEHIKNTFHFNLIKVIQGVLPKLKEASVDFDGDTRQLLVGLCLL